MEEVAFTPTAWPNTAAEDAFNRVPGVLHDYVLQELRDGGAQLYRVSSSAGPGWLVTRVEERELVLCAAVGAGLVPALRAITAGALGAGYDTVRCHSGDWRVEQLYQRAGLKFLEVVYCARVNCGR
ncbi:hypothetical protein [Microbulbifer sp. PSTR4-B]|uniref:hypothetical protein n=1 Tax=Microbulbifer sp. PSTR4-B TaxID=3243396 RepID=UPI00403A381A